jgi:hypothetical protein
LFQREYKGEITILLEWLQNAFIYPIIHSINTFT